MNPFIFKQNILFFDFDGTIAHTDDANLFAYKYAIKKILGVNLDNYSLKNRRLDRNVLSKIFPRISKNVLYNIVELKENIYNDYMSLVVLNEDVVKVIKRHHTKNEIVLVTNCRKKRLYNTLNYLNILDKFDHFIYREKFEKKHSNKFETAISNLGIPTKDIVVFENDKTDISNAINAGINSQNIIFI